MKEYKKLKKGGKVVIINPKYTYYCTVDKVVKESKPNGATMDMVFIDEAENISNSTLKR